MRGVCRCSSTQFPTVLRYKRGIWLHCHDALVSRFVRSCSICFNVHVASRKMQFVTAACQRNMCAFSFMKTNRSGTVFRFDGSSWASLSKPKSHFQVFSNYITSFCRRICTSCVVSSPHKFKISRKEYPDNRNSSHQCDDLSGELKPDNTHGTTEHGVQDQMERQGQKENIKTIPNMLTALRMASAPLLGYLVVSESFVWALGIFVCAGISDLLDGYIARNFKNQTSVLGTALDPLADKLLVSVLTISLTCVGLIPLPLTLLIVSRDCALIAGGFYIRYRSLPPPITLSRYFDISHATAKLNPTGISKLNTGFQLTLVAGSLSAPVLGFVDHAALQALWYATGATTFASGIDYLCSWKKYVVLLEKDQKEL